MNLIERFNINLIENNRYMLILDGVQTTLTIVVCTILLGGFLGLIICAMRRSNDKFYSIIARVYIYFFRSIPVLLLLILAFFVIFAGSGLKAITITIIAFSVYHSAFAAEIFRAGLIAIKDDQIEASVAMGFTKRQAFFYIIIPQAVRVVFPVYRGEMIRQTSISSIVGYIGVRDLTRATDIVRSQTFDAFFPLVVALIIYFLIIAGITLVLNLVEKLINPKKVKI